MKLSLNVPICINVLNNESINSFIFPFSLSWKDGIND